MRLRGEKLSNGNIVKNFHSKLTFGKDSCFSKRLYRRHFNTFNLRAISRGSR